MENDAKMTARKNELCFDRVPMEYLTTSPGSHHVFLKQRMSIEYKSVDNGMSPRGNLIHNIQSLMYPEGKDIGNAAYFLLIISLITDTYSIMDLLLLLLIHLISQSMRLTL